jgi:beta-glucosidase
MITAVQEHGIASAVKHFVCNDMEHQRTSVDCIVTPRALREIYLMPFQMAIRDADPWCLMTSYNRLNGTHMSENKDILQKIVREDWAYDGCVLSDWYGTYSTVEALDAGLDLEMPGPSAWRGHLIKSAVGVGKISATVVDKSASRVLDLVEKCSGSQVAENGPEICLDSPSDRALMRRVAAEGIVLLKNESGILPLAKNKKVYRYTDHHPFFAGPLANGL